MPYSRGSGRGVGQAEPAPPDPRGGGFDGDAYIHTHTGDAHTYIRRCSYAFLLPSKYNPSKERPFPDTDAYFEDNFDAVSNISVVVTKSKGV